MTVVIYQLATIVFLVPVVEMLTKKMQIPCLEKTNAITDNYHLSSYTNLSFIHAESPVWDGLARTLYWVDVGRQNVHSLRLNNMEHRSRHISSGEVNLVLPIAGSKRLLVGVRSHIYLLDWHKPGVAGMRFVASLDEGKPDNVLNEGKADAYGRFWGGTKGLQRGDIVVHDEAALYSLEQPLLIPRVQLKPVTISNGLVWSLNNSILYYIDSETGKIEAFAYNLKKGQISNRRTIIDVRDYGYIKAIPDGMTIDREGLLWVALMFEGAVIRIDPDLRLVVTRYKLPVSRITSVAWAGDKLEDLVVTTSRRNMAPYELKKEPLAGTIFILHDLGTGGVPDNKFVFHNADEY